MRRASPDADDWVCEWIGMVTDVDDRKRAEEALRFLAEASEVLSSSLDYRETLASVAHLAVPTLADWCVVDILAEDGSLERLAVAHSNPKKVVLAYELQERYPPDPDAPRGVHHVLRTGEPEMMEEIPEQMLDEATRDEEQRQMLNELGLRSYVVVPLVARGRTLGAISLITAESGRRYGETDLKLAQELARRAALAVDNAWLYEAAHKEIAERQWAQEQLRSSRDQLETILRGVADGITAQNSTGQLVYANEAAARMSGYQSVGAFVEAPLEEVMSRFEILDEEGRAFPPARLPGWRALRGEEGAEEILLFRMLETGEERWLVLRAMPIFDQEERVQLAVNIFHDVTEWRHAEQERARLAAIVESSDDAIISKTLNGTITSWNKGAESIYGYSSEEAVGQPISMLVPLERPDEIPGILQRLRRGERVDHFETVRITKEGRRLDISLTVSPIKDSAGHIVGASAIARDITERKRAEQEIRILNEQLEDRVRQRTTQLEEANKELESFSYSVSHDLRAPLRHIEGFAQLPRRRASTVLDETGQRYLNTIVQSTDHAGNLIDNLLSFSRMGRTEIHRADVEMNRLVHQALEDLKSETEGRNIDWKIGQLPKVQGDPSMLRVVMTNLLSNAVKYTSTREQAVIEVGTKTNADENADEAIFFVRDNGVGFDMQYVDKLFGVFQRLHASEEFEGTGIGLASVRRIVSRHGGHTWAQGSVGSGASFYFSLPLAQRRDDDGTTE